VVDHAADFGRDLEDFVYAHAPLEAAVVAALAARALAERAPHLIAEPGVLEDVLGRVVLGGAVRADRAGQPLRHRAIECSAEEVRFDTHVHEPRHRARRVVGVQRREHQVPCQRGLNRHSRRLLVSDFAHHDHIRVLAQD
jgi:hypothetical protein